ncbi:hypothetical protein BVRB_016410 [Beta vulgaris subsp. vulgaris]|uniref:Uncharacterized protein n=1 Tax=Beta vulgaris subsp. vulgaris TaxID=3555 RepID=A0A0J8B4A8_BETVV|nr:hypothetical protein BVRB_016410 [Beta vulgaris subsp. vulgaris]
MISSKSKKIWWSKLKSSFSSKKGNSKRKDTEKEGSLCRKLNVNEEYKEVFRTKSYMEIWSKVQALDDNNQQCFSRSSSSSSSSSYVSYSSSSSYKYNSSSPVPFYMHHLSDFLLEPRQEAVIDIIKSSNLQTLLNDYFDASLEACNICELLLRGIHKTRSNHRLLEKVINLSEGGMEDGEGEGEGDYFSRFTCHKIILLQELASFASLNNPLSNIINGTVDFRKIHDKYSHLLRKLTNRKRRIKRKEKFTRFYKKAAGYGFVITYSVLAIALLALAMHSMVGILGAPGLLLPLSMGVMKKVKGGGSLKANFLKHLGSQLDVAAKGMYIFINDFDTVGRLVTRLHDEVEHKREIAAMCVRNGKSHQVIREALRDIQMHQQGFVEQLEELEQHIYLCFLTINRSRRLVTEEILAPFNT